MKLFQQTYRQRVQADNPKVPVAKIMMLLSAKWREFIATGNSNWLLDFNTQRVHFHCSANGYTSLFRIH
jgi:chromodomain-helicase-DNA-binding protein 4